jgi:hypothetical protein
MPELVADCPRCGSRRITFEVTAARTIRIEYGWKYWYETFCICRHCNHATIFVLSESVDGDYKHVHEVGILGIKGTLNSYLTVDSYVSIKDQATVAPPDYIPKNIEVVFKEGATCLAVGCYNAAGTMFRLCVDLATRSMLPEEEVEGLNAKVRRDLGLRLPWLFAKGLLPETLKELSSCIKEDGNDAAHTGTLTKPDAEDLLDFTTSLLERMYTEPERLRLAQKRRDFRRDKNT